MPCKITPVELRALVISSIKEFVVPPSFVVTDDSIILQIPISLVRWQAGVYPLIVAGLRQKGCRMKSIQRGDLTKSPTVAALYTAIGADLGPAPERVVKREVLGKNAKKKKAPAKKRASRKSRKGAKK